MKAFLLINLLMVSSLAHASEQWESRLIKALDAIEAIQRTELKYRQITITPDSTEIARFSPADAEPWQLLQVDGEAPTEREQKKFLKDIEKEEERRGDDRLADLISPGTVELMPLNDQGHQPLRFKPLVEGMSDTDALIGTALWSVEDQQLLEFRITNSESFSPRFSVTVDQLEMSFRFQPLHGVAVPERYDFIVRGKLAGVKSIDIVSSIEFKSIQWLATADMSP